MKHIDIYTDGACSGNPGKGGWAAILIYNGVEKEISGGYPETTNNRMELFAIISGLKALKERCEVTVYSDSAYCVDAFNNNWIDGWIKKNWKEVKNTDLWKTLIMLAKKHQVGFVKVKGHADNEYNNRCDALARKEITLL